MSEPAFPTIHADFNNRVGRCLRLSCDGTKADLERFGIVLRDGLVLHVSDGELAATGTVEWSSDMGEWVIVIDMHKITEIGGSDEP